MNSFYPNAGATGNLQEVMPWSDDQEGARTFYPFPVFEIDLAVSNLKSAGSGAAKAVSSPKTAQAGEDVLLEYTLANVGDLPMTFNVGFYLSKDAIITAADRRLAEDLGAYASGGSLGTFSRALNIPADVDPGTYYLGVFVDPLNRIAESREWNNAVPMPVPIRIE